MEPMFTSFKVELACEPCKEAGKAPDCKHMLHLVPNWQSSSKHIRLKTIMGDRPDLIQSELSGIAFESLQQAFRKIDIDAMLQQPAPKPVMYEPIYIFIDPAAGGPSSDYGIMSITRNRGIVTVFPRSSSASADQIFLSHNPHKIAACRRLLRQPRLAYFSHLQHESPCLFL